MKAADTAAAYGCCDCHRVLDGHAPRPNDLTRDEMLALFELAIVKTNLILTRKGLLPAADQKPEGSNDAHADQV